MSDFPALWSGVEQARADDPAPLLVCADWCDEHQKVDLAYSLKWCAGKKRRPYLRTDVSRNKWQWYENGRRFRDSFTKAQRQDRVAAVLQPVFFVCAASRSDDWRASFATGLDAYSWLAETLANLRKAVEVPDIVLPPQPDIARIDPVVCDSCGVMRGRHVTACPVCHAK